MKCLIYPLVSQCYSFLLDPTLIWKKDYTQRVVEQAVQGNNRQRSHLILA
ncbi:MAG: hypothetical protein F6K55_07035 [Moorea sp. SIO4A3]|nr:hypothetical protein [Moorena sp. SIO4A3]